ncbi:hypothetical protein NBRC10512_003741 [Rhodotorula toruloides]|uniref:RHTO0S03e13190g1_1 n=2 Tax=Rhodotorula toruloides TaxID=5286 RepID=A0A061ANQ3_RHOTO|nr:Zn(2)-C6 fungal-type transcription factor [Rhodotorula toruloides NP11]EMS26190.1 Zn(2)-C6 fungal-type transcription factor [Rhodotorula toruloides NP11]CDR38783.1 RHTO0S03e13190g1_1 [Rhodotorula toruloides]
MTATPTSKHILQKGAACSTCKARKVRCNAAKPACDACRRSARFRGEDPELVVCSYTVGRRCGAGKDKEKETPKRSRSTGRPARDVDVVVASPSAEAAASATPGRSEKWIEYASNPLPALQEPVPPLAIPQQFFLPSPASSSSASFASASTPASSSSSSFPSPVLDAAPTFEQRPQRFNLPAPIPVAPFSSTLPAFLGLTSPSFGAASLPSKQAPEIDAATLLQQLDAAYPFVIATSPESYAAPLPDPHSPVSSASLSSFHSGEDASSTYSSVSSSPFSLYDDLDFALALSNAPSYPPQPAPFNDYKTLPLFSAPPQLTYDAQSHPAAPLLPSTAFFVDHSNPFLPTAHDGDKTLALPLFGSTPAYQWS